MRRVAVPLLLAAAAAACSEAPVPHEELALRVESEPYEVRLAEGFPLTVTRVWSRELVPEEWSDETLAPLVVRQEDVALRSDATHVVETRSFTAYAPELGDVRVLPPLLVATRGEGGDEVVVSGEALDLRVLPVLPRGDASAVELPGGLRGPPRTWPLWLAALGLVLGAGAVATRVLRRRPVPPAPEPAPALPVEGPEVRALRTLADAETLADGDDPRPLHDGVSDAVRTYVRERFGVGTPEWTTEELLEAYAAAGLPAESHIRAVLRRCALVRFARAPSDERARRALVEEARELVRATAGAAS